MVAVYGLIDFVEPVKLFRIKKVDVWTLLIGIEQGILIGVAFSLALFVWRSAYPHTTEVGYLPEEEVFRNANRYPEAQTFPDTLIVRVDASLYFANTAFWEEVVRRVVMQPVGFFSSIPRRGNFAESLVFALICLEISTILGGILRLAWLFQASGVRFQGEEYCFGDFIASVIFAPIGGVIGLFILAGIAHLLVMLFVGAGNSGFESTFRVVSYVSVTNLVNWIPVIGGRIAPYGLYLAVVGVIEMHNTTTGRASLVVLVPFAVILFLVLLILLVAGAFLLGRFA